jgi:7-cyano-7-deazaguanine reductase
MNTYKQEYVVDREPSIRTSVLEAIPWAVDMHVALDSEFISEEFISRCPFSGLPDFGKIVISYTPDKSVVEMKSLKLYMTSYASVGITQERACQRICHDLGTLLSPHELAVMLAFSARGGILHTLKAEWVK